MPTKYFHHIGEYVLDSYTFTQNPGVILEKTMEILETQRRFIKILGFILNNHVI